MEFLPVKQAISAQFSKMLDTGMVLTTSADKDNLWDTYLNKGTEQGLNDIFRERGALDCNCCRRYIRASGGVVAFIDGELVTMWDIQVGGEYQPIVDALAKIVRESTISGIFLHEFKTVGIDKTPDLTTDIIWDHFYMKLPSAFVKPKSQIATLKGKAVNNYNVLKRSLAEITQEAVNAVIDLIASKSIYKGAENKKRVTDLAMYQQKFKAASNKEEFLWETSLKLGEASAFRNSAIGTLLTDLSEDMDLTAAVKSYETKVAPENYKRSSSLITQAMINRAQDTLVNRGMEESTKRRHAVTEDITINDVLFADRTAKVAMGVLAGLKPTASKEVAIGKATDISIVDFMNTVIPCADSMEVLVENTHSNNFMSLVAPVVKDSPPMTKWANNFSWSYNGELADSSMRDNVKALGGKVDGALRFSIQWNTPGRLYQGDLDAHCNGPKGEHISYQNKRGSGKSGTLDVDIQTPRGVAVENIIYTDIKKMPDGDYRFVVNNYSSRTNNKGFTAEIEFGGAILSFDYIKPMHGGSDVAVATIAKKGDTFTVTKAIENTESKKTVYGIDTKEFRKVSLLMNSPNYWDCEANPKGNKHYFFILEGCKNPDDVRGFYNEFLADALHDDRKVFEVLGSQMKVPFEEVQLSGLGFSETQTNRVTVKVRGDINKTFSVKFN